jgi:hypothetical protein
MKFNWMVRLVSVSMAIWLVSCNLSTTHDTPKSGNAVYPPCDPAVMVKASLISPQACSTSAPL